MGEYYLISQLPSLDGLGEGTPLPITEQRFMELCEQLAGKKVWHELCRLSLIPSRNYEETTSGLIEAWNENERSLRLALGKVRAEKLKKPFDSGNASLLLPILKAASTAVEMESPLEAEKFLNRYRLDFLETLRPIEPFSEEFVFYYWLKLRLLLRIRQFDQEHGELAYKNIYHSIWNTDMEVM